MSFSLSSLAAEGAPELLDLFKEDPSLLLDPTAEVPAPPEGAVEEATSNSAQAPKASPLPPPSLVAAPPSVPVVERDLSSQNNRTVSELEALPGVNDFAIILSGDQFFPAQIRMKNGGKSRLLFVTTGQKSAALVFIRPRINRWISPKGERSPVTPREPSSVEEMREINASKVAEIQFDAEPGVYQFYDALTGAKGEVKVE